MSVSRPSGKTEIQTLDPRDGRALRELMSAVAIDEDAGKWTVYNAEGHEYPMDVCEGVCSCEDFTHGHNHCKHLRRVEYIVGDREVPEWVNPDEIERNLRDRLDSEGHL